MKRVGLTGGIGSGKTYISKIFNKLGIPVFDSDFYAKQLMVRESSLIKLLKNKFGSDIYINQEINKNKLSDIIFNKRSSLQDIQNIVHPFVEKEFQSWVLNQNSHYVLKEAAILFETGSYKLMDFNILVYADLETRIKRVVKRDNKQRVQVMNIINSQVNFSDIKKLADYIIINNEEDFILPQIMRIHNDILKKQ